MPEAPEGRCPGCLIAAATESSSLLTGAEIGVFHAEGSSTPARAGTMLAPGQSFGAYRIERLLGQGGMGDVYEAEHVEQGRRVALKVLNQRLTRPEDRARFLREGQLAASLSHPHVCYVFGSEEILGVSAISMELLPGGTLKDRVQRDGPLSSAQAVDAILQVIAGLDAAQRAGILHRDVKPANCFIDRDGAVKIGDFGLSISTSSRDLSQFAEGGFQGTPQFAAPEQLRGEALDVRSDIYAVGVTLYYLLTGGLPYDDADLETLVRRVTTDAPRSPRAVRSTVPRGLDRVVQRCMAKQRLDRLQSYAALEDALRPFASSAATPATMGLRCLALVADRAVLSLATIPLSMVLLVRGGDVAADRAFVFALYVFLVAYYSVQEGVWGATLGKRVVGLQVTDRSGQAPGLARATRRALIFVSPMFLSELPGLISGRAGLSDPPAGRPLLLPALANIAYWLAVALMFSTARRRNGFAGVHELLSGTRVVRRSERGPRPILDLGRDHATTRVSAAQYGPYTVAGRIATTADGELLLGFDPRLRRAVWIHVLAAGAAAVPQRIRGLSRPGRLHWLGGQRSDNVAWDAYEALDGAPFVSIAAVAQPWGVVKHWLHDLSTEIDAALPDGSPPTLALDRLWITRDGRARLLDFGVPGEGGSALLAEPTSLVSAQTFLDLVARRALHLRGPAERRTVPDLPLSASSLLHGLTAHTFPTTAAIVATLRALLGSPDRLARGRRAASVLLSVALPAAVALMTVGFGVLWQRLGLSEVEEMRHSLYHLSKLSETAEGDAALEREALELYIADRFGRLLSDPTFWANPFRSGLVGPLRPLAQRVIAEHGSVSPDQLAESRPALARFLRAHEREVQSGKETPFSTNAVRVAAVSLLPFVVLALVASVLLRGGLLLSIFRIAVVTRCGAQVSRGRALGRALITWSPALMVVPAAFPALIPNAASPLSQGASLPLIVFALATGLFLAGVTSAILNPERGLQDRLAGTWLVPR